MNEKRSGCIAFVRATNIYDDSRATKTILSLVAAGYSVKVFGWNRNGVAAAESQKVFEEHSEKVSLCFFDCPLPNGIGIKNIDKLLQWERWVKKSLCSSDGFMAVHACNLDAGIGAANYCKRKKIPLIYDIYDYYTDSHSIPSFLTSLVEGTEIKIINDAFAVIICTEERREQIAKASPRQTVVIHNSPDIDEKTEADELEYDYAYCGSLAEKRLVGEILDAFPTDPGKKFVFAGYGQYAEKARDLSEKYDSFTFLDTIPYSEVIKAERASRVLSAIYEPTIRNHRLCAPNKFYESLALAKPVIVCRGTGIDKIVEQNRLGTVIGYDADEFYQALNRLVSDPELCREYGRNARALYEKEYRWKIMEQRLLALYSQLDN